MSENLDTSRQSQPIPDANRHDSDPLGEPGSEGGIPKSIEAASPVSRKPVQLDGRRADRVQQQLRTIYDTINRYDLPKPNPLLQPLIQRPVFSAPSGTNDSEKTPIDIDPDSAITWKDSLEATIEHLKDELGSLDPRSQDAVDLTHYLNVLDSLGSNQSFVDLASRLEELRSELPPHQFQAIEHLINGSGKAGSSLIAQLKTAVNQVAKTANLQLVNAAFCTQVDGFGDYVPFEQNRFRPDDEVLLYCELENFSQEPVNDPHSAGYRCRFDAQLEFLNADGSFDFVKSYTDIKDVCRNQREDFYLFFRFRIPRLKTGMHRLQIRITDKVGRKNATLANPITFEVAEPPAE